MAGEKPLRRERLSLFLKMQRSMPVEQAADDPAVGLDLLPGKVVDEGFVDRGPEGGQ